MAGIWGDGQRGGIFGAKVDPRLLQAALEQRAEAERQQAQGRIAGAFDASQGMQQPSQALYEAKHQRAMDALGNRPPEEPAESGFWSDLMSSGSAIRGTLKTMTDPRTSPFSPAEALRLFMDPAGEAGRQVEAGRRLVEPVTQFNDPNVDPVKQATDLTLATMGMSSVVPASAAELRMGIKAYHGSPHSFEKFDSSKIGTGEGAQAYGHGLYFAEREGVAKDYRNKLAGAERVEVDGKPIWNRGETTLGRVDLPREQQLALDAITRFVDPEEAARFLQGRSPTHEGPGFHEARLNAIELLRSGRMTIPTRGKMYEVDITADPEHFLDWDKPLSEQSPKVRGALDKASSAEGQHHILARDAKLLSDTTLGPSFLEKGYGSLDAPSRRVMVQRVLSMVDNPQIRDDVVGLIPVDVMNVLTRQQGSPEARLHEATVLFDKLAASRGDNVALGVDRATSTMVGIANAAAKRLGGNPDVIGIPEELRTALRAGKGNHDKPVGDWIPRGENTSKWLQEQGISGTRYLDQGSRVPNNNFTLISPKQGQIDEWTVINRQTGKHELFNDEAAARDYYEKQTSPTRNYVVFPGNEHLISILKKYGLPISAAGLAALSQLHPQEAQAAQKRGKLPKKQEAAK